MVQRSIGNRIEEMKKIYVELEKLELGDQFDEIKTFQMICNDYVRKGEAVSGTIIIPNLMRKLVYNFPSSSNHKCMACLKAL